jgi:GNAT superfamily N-acetyltransferase
MEFTIRSAQLEDVSMIERLMKFSMKSLGESYYSQEELQGCYEFVCVPDTQLIEDGTFFVVLTSEGEMIGCGGWSDREKLFAGSSDASEVAKKLDPKTDAARIRAMFCHPNYAGKGVGSLILKHAEQEAKKHGFSKASLGATLSGLEFYERKGWKVASDATTTLPNGVILRVVGMEKVLS